MKKHDIVSSTIWLTIGLAILFNSLNLGLGSLSVPGSGFMPFLAGALIFFFAFLVLIGAIYRKGEVKQKLWTNIDYTKVSSVFVVLLLYIFLLEKIGFIVGTFLLISLLMLFIGSRGWLQSLIGGIIATVVCYFLFNVWLQTQLPKGFLGI